MAESKSEKAKIISLRLDSATAKKLDELVEARGLSVSEIIRKCINDKEIVQIGNVSDLSKEFCKIRILLENGKCEEIREVVDRLCRYILELLVKIEGLEEYENV